jgi:methylenetetrahydrofolate dehydrogenase (NADP+) / methenyltetrahydrofolate cyclohydrolase
MIINGRDLAQEILENLRLRIEQLKEKGTTPHMYIFLLTDNPATLSYIRQKMLYADKVGIKVTVENVDHKTSTNELLTKINRLNQDSTVHGIIIQRPVPKELDTDKLDDAIASEKEIDGFTGGSKYEVPVAMAVTKILNKTHEYSNENSPFIDWLKTKNIVVLGKGETAGRPIINHLNELGIHPQIIDSKTNNKDALISHGDIIISAVGKEDVINSSALKKGAILIGVGMHKSDEGKFKGDYKEENVDGIASFYTPTPGGVGPVNVACLLQNLVEAFENSLK